MEDDQVKHQESNTVNTRDDEIKVQHVALNPKEDEIEGHASTKKDDRTARSITDEIYLLREQLQMLAGEVALSTSSLKRSSEAAANNPDSLQLKEHILKDEISEEKQPYGWIT